MTMGRVGVPLFTAALSRFLPVRAESLVDGWVVSFAKPLDFVRRYGSLRHNFQSVEYVRDVDES